MKNKLLAIIATSLITILVGCESYAPKPDFDRLPYLRREQARRDAIKIASQYNVPESTQKKYLEILRLERDRINKAAESPKHSRLE